MFTFFRNEIGVQRKLKITKKLKKCMVYFRKQIKLVDMYYYPKNIEENKTYCKENIFYSINLFRLHCTVL